MLTEGTTEIEVINKFRGEERSGYKPKKRIQCTYTTWLSLNDQCPPYLYSPHPAVVFVNKSLTTLSRHLLRGRAAVQRHHLKMRVLSAVLVLVLCVCRGAVGVQVKVSIICSWKYS